MKKIKSIFCSAALMLALFNGCENSITSSENHNINEERVQSANIASKTFNTIFKLAPGETVVLDENLPFKTFSHFKLKNISTVDAGGNICSEISYWFTTEDGFYARSYSCIQAGKEIEHSDQGLLYLEIENRSESVLNFEITIYE